MIDISVTTDTASSIPAIAADIPTPTPSIDTNNLDTMPTEPVTSLLDITQSTPQVSILDIGADIVAPEPIISPIATAVDVPTPAMRSPMSGSLGEKIGGFADELR